MFREQTNTRARLLTATVAEWEGRRDNDMLAQPGLRHIASMAGDSETHLRSGDENTDIIRQPFLIGVSGGTASGKVCTPTCCFLYFLSLAKLRFCAGVGVKSPRRFSRMLVDRVASATQRD